MSRDKDLNENRLQDSSIYKKFEKISQKIDEARNVELA